LSAGVFFIAESGFLRDFAKEHAQSADWESKEGNAEQGNPATRAKNFT
jgi:hypothetical protein